MDTSERVEYPEEVAGGEDEGDILVAPVAVEMIEDDEAAD